MAKRRRNKVMTLQQAIAKLQKKVTFRDRGNKAFLVGQVTEVKIIKKTLVFTVSHVYGRGANVYHLKQDQIDFI